MAKSVSQGWASQPSANLSNDQHSATPDPFTCWQRRFHDDWLLIVQESHRSTASAQTGFQSNSSTKIQRFNQQVTQALAEIDRWIACRNSPEKSFVNTDANAEALVWANNAGDNVSEQSIHQHGAMTNSGTQPTILLTEADPEKFLSTFLAACIARCPVVLGNPHWTATEQTRARAIATPDLIWGTTYPESAPPEHSPPPLQPGWILIPTGGSSGNLRFAIHTWETLMASVQGFQTYFQVEHINSCCTLPLYHVSGLMQFLRSLTSGGTLVVMPFKPLLMGELTGELAKINPSHYFLSLVPTQLQRLLDAGSADWLAKFSTILLGGAPAWPDLLERARQQSIRLAPTYGMTETASQVATLKPDDFLQGKPGVGQVLPHAAIHIGEAPDRPSLPGTPGILWIRAASLALGYCPLADPQTPCSETPYSEAPYSETAYSKYLKTDDLGYFDPQGHLHITGRNHHTIITGGENVFPAEVEAVIRATGLVKDVCVLGLPDPDWGERVTAVYVPLQEYTNSADLHQAITPHLSAYKRPKQWLAIASLPRNAQGKINYAALTQLLLSTK